MRPSHLSTPLQSRAACAAINLSKTSDRGTGGSHVFLWRFQPAFWHSAPQYEACLQREHFLSSTPFPPCLPQWAQLGTLAWTAAIASLAVLADMLRPSKRACSEQHLRVVRAAPEWSKHPQSSEAAPEGSSTSWVRGTRYQSVNFGDKGIPVTFQCRGGGTSHGAPFRRRSGADAGCEGCIPEDENSGADRMLRVSFL
ncbi:hypothetical protein T484DRAFT_2120119 [Baffinella frigidus]|nr:hypothetical protein T484DRAFT_2120119 [Cryptophyta sp. CCMP2293]